MSLAVSTAVHVATDWPAFGLFFLGLAGTMGGFCAWVLRRMDKNRTDWKDFVSREVQAATTTLKVQVGTLSDNVAENTRELRQQGTAIARVEGMLSVAPPGPMPTGNHRD